MGRCPLALAGREETQWVRVRTAELTLGTGVGPTIGLSPDPALVARPPPRLCRCAPTIPAHPQMR